jgi:hypothetical protein
MKLMSLVFAVSLLAQFSGGPAVQEPPKPAVAPSFEGCLAKGSAEGTFLLQSARDVSGTVVGTGLRFRLVADTKDIALMPHVNHVVRVTGPVEGTIPPAGSTVPEADLPQIRVKALSMISSECIVPR